MPNTTEGDRTVIVETQLPPPKYKFTNDLVEKLRDMVRPLYPTAGGSKLDLRIIVVAAIFAVGAFLIFRKRKRG